MATAWLGWASVTILLVGLVRQVCMQWQGGRTAGGARGYDPWQVLALAGLVLCSALRGDLIFLVATSLLLLAALSGPVLLHAGRRRRSQDGTDSAVVQVSRRQFRAGRAGRPQPRSRVR